MKKFEMLNIICKDCELTAKEKLVAQYFVYKSNKSGACYPCVDKIAEECSVSRRTVQRATKKLAEKEYILIQKRFKLGRQMSNLYTFNILLLDEIQREKECEQEQDHTVNTQEMEMIDFDEMLQLTEELPKEFCATYPEEEPDEIDLDELAAMCSIEMDGCDNEIIDDVDVESVETVINILEEVPEKMKQDVWREYSCSVIMQVLLFICRHPEQTERQVIFNLLDMSYVAINPKFVVYQKCGASRIKIMGAFFPP